MERSAAATTSSEFVRWEELYVSGDKGRREVHYYLERRDGTSDLAVVGKEKSMRHVSYHYAIRDRSLLSISPSSSLSKLRSRKEVIDWLNSIVSDSSSQQSSQAGGGSSIRKDAYKSDVEPMMVWDASLKKRSHHAIEFLWLGSSWTCRKRRMHYHSFCHNGVKISVHDFVFVLAEEDKRLVAYLNDMYEDHRGNKMVVVQWFHKIDEVGTASLENYNEREIFFSVCLQDLSIECIDGLATVLSPHHYEKFMNKAIDTQLELFVCSRQIDNDDVKPFDITQLKGYWRQQMLRNMDNSSCSKDSNKPCEYDLKVEKNLSDGVGIRPKKRLRRLKDAEFSFFCTNKQESATPCLDMYDNNDSLVGSGKQPIKEKPSLSLTVGSQVEVLSQDSGLRGCWFRAVIVKKHKDKVKVQYQDIKDAADESCNLEEWVLVSKVAKPDPLGLRFCDRKTVRPICPSNKRDLSSSANAGTVVDVWWHDGWWEGIIIQKETEDRIHVYFPGERRESIFGSCDLRCSQEWVGNGWEHIKERPDIVTAILSGSQSKQTMAKTYEVEKDVNCDAELPHSAVPIGGISGENELGNGICPTDSPVEKEKDLQMIRDLSKDVVLAQLKWKSSGKRSRLNASQKLHNVGDKCKKSPEPWGRAP
ncbi:DNA (cytosine-5-)-methyltransferase [Bertholletia excelsa]